LYINRGALLTKQGQFAAAVPDFEKAWKLKSTEDAAVFLGASLINVQRYDSAINHLKKVTNLFPDNLVLKERLGYSYAQKKQFENAIAQYHAILQKDPKDFRSWAAKGYCYQELDKDAEAINAFENSYTILPNQTVGNELASMYAVMNSPKTIAFCDALIKADSAEVKNVQPIYYKGLYYKNAKDNAQAKLLFDLCIKTDYTYAYPYIDKAAILYEEKNYDAAIKLLDIAKPIDNKNPEIYYLMGNCLAAVGNKDAAKIEYERVLALDKTYTEAANALKAL
jgi:tetratricopeptide (TPR) repeat protein